MKVGVCKRIPENSAIPGRMGEPANQNAAIDSAFRKFCTLLQEMYPDMGPVDDDGEQATAEACTVTLEGADPVEGLEVQKDSAGGASSGADAGSRGRSQFSPHGVRGGFEQEERQGTGEG